MGKKVNLSAYTKPLTKRMVKKHFIMLMLIGLLWVIILMLPWLIWLKPYKKFEHYESDAVYGKNIFVIGTHEEKIIYYVEDIKYEKIIKYSRTYYVHNTTKLDFYYEMDNPNYTINDRKSCLIAFPCVASAGFLLCGWAIWNYKRGLNKLSNNIAKENSNEKFIEKK